MPLYEYYVHETKDKDAAWEFMKWWSTADIQAKYGKDLEMLMVWLTLPDSQHRSVQAAAMGAERAR